MRDPRLEKFARLLIQHSLSLKKDDLFGIYTTSLAAPLVKEIYRQALEIGAHPFCRVELEGLHEIFLREATEEGLHFLSPLDLVEIEQINARLTIQAPFNTKALSGVDPRRQTTWQKTRSPISRCFMQRQGDGSLRWSYTIYPNQANSQDAGMSLLEYTDFIFRAMHLEEEDPAHYWQELSRQQEKLIKTLERGKEIRVLGSGTDFRVSVEGRKWVNAAGQKNMPDGELFTSPLETSAEGHILFSFPAIYQDREVEGVRMVFEQGRVEKAEAQKGEDYLLEVLQVDEGACYIGEFAFGNNFAIERFMGDILLDEKIGGTLHIALGSAYPETGGRNVSAIHWDFICDLREGSEVRMDGEVIQRDGKWLI